MVFGGTSVSGTSLSTSVSMTSTIRGEEVVIFLGVIEEKDAKIAAGAIN